MTPATANKIGRLTVISYTLWITGYGLPTQADDPAAKPQYTDPGKRQSVLYVTNRAVRATKDGKLRYWRDLSSPAYGRVVVRVAPRYPLGQEKGPSPLGWLTGGTAMKVRQHVVLSTTAMEEDAFTDQLAGTAQTPNQREFLIFVHGFSVSFDNAARRAAQIVSDLQFDGTAVMFSWPSRGQCSQRDYWTDVASMNASGSLLRDLIQTLTEQAEPAKIHVISHSLGCKLVGDVLASISAERLSAGGPLIDQVILAAPDMDVDEFRTVIAPQVQRVAKRVTVYVSQGDQALEWSRRFRLGRQRLGEANPTVATTDGVVTVDASRVNTQGFGHSYYTESPVVVRDIQGVLRGTSPEQRGLYRHEIEESDHHFWEFETVQIASHNPST